MSIQQIITCDCCGAKCNGGTLVVEQFNKNLSVYKLTPEVDNTSYVGVKVARFHVCGPACLHKFIDTKLSEI